MYGEVGMRTLMGPPPRLADCPVSMVIMVRWVGSGQLAERLIKCTIPVPLTQSCKMRLCERDGLRMKTGNRCSQFGVHAATADHKRVIAPATVGQEMDMHRASQQLCTAAVVPLFVTTRDQARWSTLR